MFEVGRRYWAVNGDYRIKVLCIGRTRTKATFTADAKDAARYFRSKPRFTKKVTPIEVSGSDGRIRECVARMGDRSPACDWCITDQEVVRKASSNRRETGHERAGEVGLELFGGKAHVARGTGFLRGWPFRVR